MPSDIEIARQAQMLPMQEIAAKLGMAASALIPYGRHKAKIDVNQVNNRPAGKLVLVTAVNPTPAGEGKTTTTVGLGDALSRRGVRVAIALREPSLGPVFGMKGGAAGGGYAQVVPMEDINLHFTGDFHAIGAANNLLCAMVDNHIYQGNALQIDPQKISVRRCVDMNDRQLRNVVDGLGGSVNGRPREDGFDITVASEVMAALCLAQDITDLKLRLSRMVCAQSLDGKPVTAGQVGAAGAMTVLLKDAMLPNLVQTLENTPAFVHGGPFANIAHGCNSIAATRLALNTADVVVTEAGFGADLGAEKFLDIKCRQGGIAPSACVIVATLRALKYHGGATKETWSQPDMQALEKGLPVLLHHINVQNNVFGMPVVVAINCFPGETQEERNAVIEACKNVGASCVESHVWERGGEGGLQLADAVLAAINTPSKLTFSYEDNTSAMDKMNAIVQKVYGGAGVELLPSAKKELEKIQSWGFGNLPVCMAKTQYSLTDDAKKLGKQESFIVTVRQIRLSAGAGFLVALTGDIMTMPGLPKVPAAVNIDLDDQGVIQGLF